jgi:3alpha(or 20beta)-hydroxysteroid dehydrogenase
MSVFELTGRKALVTGGARGLGHGMAEALARAGAAVVIADVQEELGKKTADALCQSGAICEFVPLDVTSEASWDQAMTQAVSTLGGLDILVNNAGVEISSLVIDIEAADLRRMLEVNVLGTALGIKHAFPSRVSPATPPPSRPWTGSPGSRPWNPASSATASG